VADGNEQVDRRIEPMRWTLLLLIVAGACSSSAASSSAPAPSEAAGVTPAAATVDEATLCDALRVVRAAADETGTIMNAALSRVTDGDLHGDDAFLAELDRAADEIEALLPGLDDAYDRAIAVAPDDVAADLGVIRELTAELVPALIEVIRSAETADALGTALDELLGEPELAPAISGAGLASLRLDDYAMPTCGLRFSNA
jgi:hypothetical protein